MIDRGKVYLVGAGPGDPGLITVAGLSALRRADVVLYDRLIGAELLDEAPPHAVRIPVGKTPGGPSVPQRVINALLVVHADAGRVVVRLKGGDPFVFGRGAEEALACAEAGVRWEVIPGVSSVLGATGRAAIPVTLRGEAGAFAVVSGHRADGVADEVDWSALARIDTLVVLMGIGRLQQVVERLLRAGRGATTPVAIIERGTRPDQRIITGLLRDIVGLAERAHVRPPAAIVIGEVVRFRAALVGSRSGSASETPVDRS